MEITHAKFVVKLGENILEKEYLIHAVSVKSNLNLKEHYMSYKHNTESHLVGKFDIYYSIWLLT